MTVQPYERFQARIKYRNGLEVIAGACATREDAQTFLDEEFQDPSGKVIIEKKIVDMSASGALADASQEDLDAITRRINMLAARKMEAQARKEAAEAEAAALDAEKRTAQLKSAEMPPKGAEQPRQDLPPAPQTDDKPTQ